MSQADGLTELKALANIINNSIGRIESALKNRGLTYPSLNTLYSDESEAARAIPEVLDASALIVTAASQLVATARPPRLTAGITGGLICVPPCLGVAVESHVSEILREGGPEGVHIKEIARLNGVDSHKLARIMRLLATSHIFRELTPDVFTNNRISSVLDTGKTMQEIIEKPFDKHQGSNGIAAIAGNLADEGMKAMSYLVDYVMGPVRESIPDNYDRSAFRRAFRTEGTVWDLYEQPGQDYRRSRFAMLMYGVMNLGQRNAVVNGYDWTSLGKGAIVVDVGGGIGSQSMVLASDFPDLRFVVQDFASVLKTAEEVWDKDMPGARAAGRVVLQPHDFFTPQPVKDAAVFYLHNVLHDWDDERCTTILKHLRAAARPSSQLVVAGDLVLHACEEHDTEYIPGAVYPSLPSPLLQNGGQANIFPYIMDLEIMGILPGACERSLTEYQKLLDKTGWKIVRVHHGAPFLASHQKVICVPV